MNKNLIEIIKNIENLSNEDLTKVSAWVEFNLRKRNFAENEQNEK